jgi:hypothetical protein
MNRRLSWLVLGLWALALASCATREAALTSMDGSVPSVVTDCDAALAAFFRAEAAPCDFVARCSVAAGACCTQEVVCEAGLVVGRPLSCEVGCIECRVDRECPATQLCDGTRCAACPGPPVGAVCPMCPPALEPVVRNGCSTCDCRPHTACRAASDCAPADVCLPGQACDPACPDPDALACCANVCGPSTCPFPVPMGCVTVCPPDVLCAGPCMTINCRCDGTSWTCDRVCAPPGYPPVATCAL